ARVAAARQGPAYLLREQRADRPYGPCLLEPAHGSLGPGGRSARVLYPDLDRPAALRRVGIHRELNALEDQRAVLLLVLRPALRQQQPQRQRGLARRLRPLVTGTLPRLGLARHTHRRTGGRNRRQRGEPGAACLLLAHALPSPMLRKRGNIGRVAAG